MSAITPFSSHEWPVITVSGQVFDTTLLIIVERDRAHEHLDYDASVSLATEQSFHALELREGFRTV